MAEFFDNHGMYSLRGRPRWRTVAGGSRRYVEAISAPWRDRIRLRTPVRRIQRLPGGAVEADGCETEDFDEVVIAVHSDQALAMLADPTRRARGAGRDPIPAQRGRAAHRCRAAAAARARLGGWNYHLPSEPPIGAR